MLRNPNPHVRPINVIMDNAFRALFKRCCFLRFSDFFPATDFKSCRKTKTKMTVLVIMMTPIGTRTPPIKGHCCRKQLCEVNNTHQ